jgi:copper chaperone NosL
MIISEPKFSAVMIDVSGEVYKFDDIGCARLYVEKNELALKRLWVHDYVSENWLDGQKAYFIVSESLITPMGHGVVAFDTESKAHDFLKGNQAKMVSWEKMKDGILNNIDSVKGGISNEGK